MRMITIETYRDGPWWMVRIPELDDYQASDGRRFVGEALTQARAESSVEPMARELAASVLDLDVDEIEVVVR